MLGAIASLFGTVANNNANRNIAEEDRRFQQQENEKARQYNLMLAKYQNAENVAQWRRESNFNEQMMDKQNAYSSPAAQMSRYAAAGLNPNLIYGQSNVSAGINGSSAAGSMTGGASSPVADAAATSERHGRQSYSTALGEVGKGLMNLPLYREEVRKMKLENDEKEQDIASKESDNSFTAWLRTADPYTNSDSPFAKSIAGRRAWFDLQNTMSDNNLKDVQLSLSTFEHQMKQKSADYLLRKLAAETYMTEAEAKTFSTKIAFELGILKADSRIKTSESFLHNPEFMQKLDKSGWQWATTFSNFIKTILNPFK